MSVTYRFDSVLGPAGWIMPGWVAVNEAGDIEAVSDAAPRRATVEAVAGHAVPGMANLHSHAFQRALAGRAERAGIGEDSFWSWRAVMYRFVERLTPDHVQAIATQLYIEMLKAGFTATAEFHYLHNAPDGGAYADRGEMSVRIRGAAAAAGIGLTLLPVLYTANGFGGAPAGIDQRRFVMGVDELLGLVADLRARWGEDPQFRIGIAPHSLRAVPPDALARALQGMAEIDDRAPVHIHIAEQRAEVEDCRAWSGARPVEWLLDHAAVDRRWCLVHATHMSALEIVRAAATGAVAGLCPTTEANLGDGLFPLQAWRAGGGQFGIGSDSHVSVSPVEELRWLEYGQRLTSHRRNVAAEPGQSTGAALYLAALAGGAQALGRSLGAIAPGRRADIVVLDGAHPILAGRNSIRCSTPGCSPATHPRSRT